MIISALGMTIICLGVAWVFGGWALRLAGTLSAVAGAVGLAFGGGGGGLLAMTLGALLWAVGQGHHALRYGTVKGPLAGRVLIRSADGGPLDHSSRAKRAVASTCVPRNRRRRNPMRGDT
jgi:hypothetical protein